MFKKIAAFAGSAALLLAVASPSLAYYFPQPKPQIKNESFNVTKIEGTINNYSSSGGNSIDKYAVIDSASLSKATVYDGFGFKKIETGEAKAIVNMGVKVDACNNCFVPFMANDTVNMSSIKGTINNYAYSGDNSIDTMATVKNAFMSTATAGGMGGFETIKTDEALSIVNLKISLK